MLLVIASCQCIKGNYIASNMVKFSPQARGQVEQLHPILRLGWRPLCDVHCNGLVGHFLGGHDRELFVQCTNGKYANLPAIDCNSGGCIMTCSQFEKVRFRPFLFSFRNARVLAGTGDLEAELHGTRLALAFLQLLLPAQVQCARC